MRFKILLPLVALLLGTLSCKTFFSGPQEVSGRFEGYYASGFEVSSFAPCGMKEDPGFGAGYWLTGPPEVYESYNQIVTESGHDSAAGYLPVYVEFEGKLSPEGNYGHLGVYSHEITVTNLIEMSLGGVCP